MALFYFHTTTGRAVIRDEVGVHLLHLDAARDAARAMLTQHAIRTVADGDPFPDQTTIEICGADGRVLHLEWGWCLLRDPTPFEAGRQTAI